MVLEQARANAHTNVYAHVRERVRVRLMVSQPTRLAALGLARRMRTICGKERVGCRLGGGYRDESSTPGATQLLYVTTGYMVMLMAHHPEAFDKYTHLFSMRCTSGRSKATFSAC